MLRMEIALIMVLTLVAYMYFSAEKKQAALHKVFSVLLITVLVHLVLDAITVYSVNDLDSFPQMLNNIVHRCFLGSMVVVIYLFYEYIAILVEEETGRPRILNLTAKLFLAAAVLGCILLPIEYTQTAQGNIVHSYASGGISYE